MVIAIFLVGVVLAVLVLYAATVKAVEIVGVFASIALGIAVVAVGYVSRLCRRTLTVVGRGKHRQDYSCVGIDWVSDSVGITPGYR